MTTKMKKDTSKNIARKKKDFHFGFFQSRSEDALEELFGYINEWTEKWEKKQVVFSALISVSAFDPVHNKCLDGRWITNIETIDLLNVTLEDIKKEIEKTEKKNIINEKRKNNKRSTKNKN